MKSSTIAAAVGLLASTAQAIQPIVIKGKHFFYENGTEFFIRGVAYQQDVNTNTTVSATASFTDPLADSTACTRDIPILKELGTNTIRVYAINASLDHSACMDLLAKNEIYVLQDLSNPTAAINRADPTWTTALYADYAAVIDEMAPYNHTLGFFAGNEVSNSVATTNASAYVKAAVRDMKQYIVTKNYRAIGVGYATNDDADIRNDLADYFNCEPADAGVDFWGYNIYSWCGDSSYHVSGYEARTEEFRNYSVPAFFAEYGCNDVRPRPFTEVAAIYGKNMTEVWSGGVVYMYFQEANDYGLVSVIDSTSVSKLADFTSLSAQLAKATPATTAMSDYTETYTALRACPTIDSDWAAPSTLPPVASSDLCSCMEKSLSCTASSGTAANSTLITSQFSVVCGLVSCDGITSSVIDSVQGAYSVCNPAQQLSWAYNQYYLAQSSASTACDFSGNAKTQTSSESSTCKALLAEAGTKGTGTVTSNPTSGSSETGSAASGTSTSKSSSSAGSGVVVPKFDVGVLAMSTYLVLAGAVGAGALFL